MAQLFKIIASQLNCSWNIKPAKDGLFGAKNDGSWSGVVGMLQRGELDMSLADLSVTRDRGQVKLCTQIYKPFGQLFIDSMTVLYTTLFRLLTLLKEFCTNKTSCSCQNQAKEFHGILLPMSFIRSFGLQLLDVLLLYYSFFMEYFYL